MLNNFVEYQYEPYQKIFTDQTSNNSIFLGDVSAALDLQFIKRQSINIVVTAAVGMDQVVYPTGFVKHIIYPLLDTKNQNISKFFPDFYDLIEKEIQSGSILVHCAAGISRSATLVISYFMKKNNWTFKEAVKMVRDKRPIVLPNLGFERQLKQLQTKLKKQSKFPSQGGNFLITTNESRRNIVGNGFSSSKMDFLPGINSIGKKGLLKWQKGIDKDSDYKLNIESMKEAINNKIQFRMRISQHNSNQLHKKSFHTRNYHKDLILAKMQSGRNKLLERSNNFMNLIVDSNSADEPVNHTIKKLSSLSHRSDKNTLDLKNIKRNISSSKHESDSNLFDDMSKFIVSKLNLCERKFKTQKLSRPRVQHKLGQL